MEISKVVEIINTQIYNLQANQLSSQEVYETSGAIKELTKLRNYLEASIEAELNSFESEL